MQITVLTIGSRGDVQPFVALAKGLVAAGHTVKLGAPPNFESFVRENGLDFYPLGIDIQAFLQRADVKAVLESGKLTALLNGAYRRILGEMYDQTNWDAWDIAQGAEMIVYKTPVFAATSIAEKLGIPAVGVQIFPWLPTNAHPPAYTGSLINFGPFNRLAGKIGKGFFWQIARPTVNRFRHEMHMQPFPFFVEPKNHRPPVVPLLNAYSPAVLPKPSDWPDKTYVTGYWFLDAKTDWQPPADLIAFLEAGPPPVYIGFGSMTSGDPKQTVDTIVNALKQAGQRGILLGGWAGTGAGVTLPDNVYQIDSAPHDWLFERCAAVVHHGGAGTTAAGLRVGKPSLIVAHNFDQPFWGELVHELGIGPAPLRFNKLNSDDLAKAIKTAVSDPKMCERAAAMGARIRAEDGVQTAIQLIEKHAAAYAAASTQQPESARRVYG